MAFIFRLVNSIVKFSSETSLFVEIRFLELMRLKSLNLQSSIEKIVFSLGAPMIASIVKNERRELLIEISRMSSLLLFSISIIFSLKNSAELSSLLMENQLRKVWLSNSKDLIWLTEIKEIPLSI